MTQDSANQTTLSRDVFVSYASHDAPLAQTASRDFRAIEPETAPVLIPISELIKGKRQNYVS